MANIAVTRIQRELKDIKANEVSLKKMFLCVKYYNQIKVSIPKGHF